jgi:hypothetical protein
MRLHSTVDEVFTVSGDHVGTYDTLSKAQAACGKKAGTYVITPTTKVVVRDLDPKPVAQAAGTGKPAMGKPATGTPLGAPIQGSPGGPPTLVNAQLGQPAKHAGTQSSVR